MKNLISISILMVLVGCTQNSDNKQSSPQIKDVQPPKLSYNLPDLPKKDALDFKIDSVKVNSASFQKEKEAFLNTGCEIATKKPTKPDTDVTEREKWSANCSIVDSFEKFYQRELAFTNMISKMQDEQSRGELRRDRTRLLDYTELDNLKNEIFDLSGTQMGWMSVENPKEYELRVVGNSFNMLEVHCETVDCASEQLEARAVQMWVELNSKYRIRVNFNNGSVVTKDSYLESDYVGISHELERFKIFEIKAVSNNDQAQKTIDFIEGISAKILEVVRENQI